MINAKRIAKSSFLVGLMGLVLGCVVEPREGFYDHDHQHWRQEVKMLHVHLFLQVKAGG